MTMATFTLNNPTRAGYAFSGWNTANNVNVVVPQGTTGNLTFNALWMKPTEGPWTFEGVRTGICTSEGGLYLKYNTLDNTVWMNPYPWQDSWGVGFTQWGTTSSSINNKYAIYSIYSCNQSISSYTRKVLHWTYSITGWAQSFPQTTALYANDDMDALKETAVDMTAGFISGVANSAIQLTHFTQTTIGNAQWQSNLNRDFEFDNRNGSSVQTMGKALLMTQVIEKPVEAAQEMHHWAGFRSESMTWDTYYYKYVTFDANGGSGSMTQQAIENSGNLTANSFVREGYQFAGWNTSPDGSGTSYSNAAAITATAESKGPITLYAQWVDNYSVWADDNSVTGAWDEEDASGVPNAFRYVFDEPEGNIEVISSVDVVGTSVKMATPEIKKNDGFTVKYELDRVAANGEVLAEGAASSSADSLGIDFSSVKSNAFFKVALVVESTGGTASKTKALSDTTIGVLAITNAPATSIIGVPWVALAGGGAISVSNLVHTANLTEGDTIKAYDSASGKYSAWELQPDRTWRSIEVIGGADESAADAITIPRGAGVWLTRQHPEEPIYLVGQACTNKVETTLEVPEASGSQTWNLVASPKVEPVDVAQLLNSKESTDKVMVPTKGAPKNFIYVGGKWGYIDYQTDEKGFVHAKFVTDDTTVPAGTGFWYLNGDTARDTLSWEE